MPSELNRNGHVSSPFGHNDSFSTFSPPNSADDVVSLTSQSSALLGSSNNNHMVFSGHSPYKHRSHPMLWSRLFRILTCIVSHAPLRKRVLLFLTLLTSSLVVLSVLYSGTRLVSIDPLSWLPWRGMSGLERNLPQCIIIGVRKCGTRALLEFLSSHPGISHAHDEMHFFNHDEKYSLGLDWYRSQMPWSRPGQITMEKTPGYFISAKAPERIYQMNSNIKLLLIVRDPVTRTISDYTQSYTNHLKKNRSYSSFENHVMDKETGEVSEYYKPTWISLYYLHWLRWMDVFNRSQIHIVDGDSFVENPLPALRQIETFLGLEHILKEENFYFNKTRGFYCFGNDKSSDGRCLNLSKGRPHPQVQNRVLHKLYKFFKPHNEKFFALTNQYFDWTEQTRRKKKSVR